MRKPTTSQAGNYLFLAVVAAIAAFLTVGGFTPGYVPTCDHQPMRPGDTCVGSGGGTYDQMVDDHYRYDHIGFAISFPLMIIFLAIAIIERRRARRVPRSRRQ